MSSWLNKDVLIVSPAPVVPLNYGNRLRIHRVCERLKAQGARLHFLLYPAEADWRFRLPRAAFQAHQALFDTFHIAPPTRPLHTGAEGTHHALDEWWDPAIGQYLDWLCHIQRFDAAIVNYTWLSRALDHLPGGCLKILDTHDRFSGRKELFIANGLEPEFFYMEAEEEARAFARADVVWAIKREEAEVFRTMTDVPVLTVPHIDPVTRLDAPRGEYLRIGLIGANNNLNRENFERFLDDCVAHVRQHLTQVEVVVAGSVCKTLRPREEKFIRFLGYVDQTEDFYRAVDAVVVPMQFSTGLKIKTAEALSFAKPVLALAHAFEGFHPGHPWHTLSDNAEILAAVADLARRPAVLKDLEQASLRAAAATDAEVEEALAATQALHRKIRQPTFWIALNAEEARAQPLLVDHALECAEFLRHLFPSTGVLFIGPGSPDEEFCARLSGIGPVALARDAGDAAPEDPPPALVIATMEEIRAATLGLWAATMRALPAFADLPPRSAFLPLEALLLSASTDPQATDAGLVAALERFAEGQVLCAQALEAGLLPRLARRGWDFLLVPFLRGSWAAPQVQRLRGLAARPGLEHLTPPLPGPGRTLLDGAAGVAGLVAQILLRGRSERYSLPAKTPFPGWLQEILLRAGSGLDTSVDEALAMGSDSLGHDDLDRALRSDAGWARVWAMGRLLLDPERGGAAAGAAGPGAGAAPGPVPDQPLADGETPLAGLPQVEPDGIPTLGFSRLGPDATLLGQEAYFAQVRFYRPENLGFEALDAQFHNLRLGPSAIRRLSLRFFFEGEAVRLHLRRNDCSADAFADPASRWQQDDWGPFVIYKIDAALVSAYGEGLAGPDLDALAEALNLIRGLDRQIGPRLTGAALDDWGRIAQALHSCALLG